MMDTRFAMRGLVRVLTAVASFGVATTAAVSADARWRGAASCLKAIAERTRQGDEFAWALSCTPNGSNYKIVHSHQRLTATDWNWEWPLDPQGGAATSITVRDGIPWAISANHLIWWKAPPAGGDATTGGTWYYYPNNRCEGGTLTTRQVVGDTSIAVGAGNIVYVIDGSNQVRNWNGSCWAQLPTFPYRQVHEIAIFHDGQNRPWVVLDNGQFWRYTTSNVWQQVLNGSGKGVATAHVIGSDGASRWNYNFNTLAFEYDSTWTFGAITQLTDNWVLAANGTAYDWE